MTGNEGLAFARLFSQRRRDLDLSVVDLATRTGRPIEVVVAWDRGDAVPDPDEISRLADILRLPKPLMLEAVRRVSAHRQDTSAFDLPTDDKPSSTEGPPTTEEATLDGVNPGIAHHDSTGIGRKIVTAILESVSNLFTELRQSVGTRRRTARLQTNQPSYMEDPRQIVTYRLRMVFTVAGIIVLTLILRWSLTGLGSAVTDLWTALTGAL